MTEEERKEKARAYARKYRQDNLERLQAYNREYIKKVYAAEPDKLRDKSRVFRLANPEKVKAAHKKWADANRDRIRAKRALSFQSNKEEHYARQRVWDKANPGKRLELHKAWCEANADRLIDVNLRRQYGIGLADYNAMLEAQGGLCALCQCPERTNSRKYSDKRKSYKLAVDHCHETGYVRGLLCFQCNIAIGFFQDKPELVEKALKYVKRHAQLRLVK